MCLGRGPFIFAMDVVTDVFKQELSGIEGSDDCRGCRPPFLQLISVHCLMTASYAGLPHRLRRGEIARL
jgi:hypothetical protein